MLESDPEKRISASEALNSPWLMHNTQTADYSDVDLRISLLNLKKFRTQMFFQKAVLMFLASQKMTQKDEEKIRKTFEMFDVNKDGIISKEELIAGYETMHKTRKKAKKDVKKILQNIDLNHSGNIDYNGINK
jgi:calcium-dependent protein kinase